MRVPIFIITGVPGAGKTSVASALIKRFERGIHIPVDDLREWVVAGKADPVPDWTEETTQQFQLAYRSAACLAHLYAAAGFAVAIEQVIFPHDVNEFFTGKLADDHCILKIFLDPGQEIAVDRNMQRSTKSFDTEFLVEPIRQILPELRRQIATENDWIVIDNGKMKIEETVDEILKRTLTNSGSELLVRKDRNG